MEKKEMKMCCDVGNRKPPGKPSYEEMAVMGVDDSMCAGCDLYGWHTMMGEWQPLDGWCRARMRVGTVRADETKCDYFVKRGDL